MRIEKYYINRYIKYIMVIFVCLSQYMFTQVVYCSHDGVNAGSIWEVDTYDDFQKGISNNITTQFDFNNDSEYLKLEKTMNWKGKLLKNSPIGRDSSDMVLLPDSNKLVLFGGGHKGSATMENDTWIFDIKNQSWMMAIPQNNPSYRHSHAMAHIYGTDKVLLFGGYCSFQSWSNETWIYDLSDNDWIEVDPPNAPTGRIGHTMASIYRQDRVLLLGAYNQDDNSVWIYDVSENEWTEVDNYYGPKSRSECAITSLSNDDKIILFGGKDIDGNTLGDTWKYDISDNIWTEMKPNESPAPRSEHAMALIYNGDYIVLYGSSGFSVYNKETWIYNIEKNSWMKIDPFESPGPKDNHAMASVPGTDNVILFGGSDQDNKTWIFNMSSHFFNGYYISIPFDIGENAQIKKIKWYTECPIFTEILFQLRSNNNSFDLLSQNFTGPDGTNNSYYYNDDIEITNYQNEGRWIQWTAILTTVDSSYTPKLFNVSVFFNNLPKVNITTSDVPKNRDITIEFILFDDNSDISDIIVQFSFDNISYSDITIEKNNDNEKYDSSPEGIRNTFIWKSFQDIPNRKHSTVYIKIVPSDSDIGIPDVLGPFTIDNEAPNVESIYPSNNFIDIPVATNLSIKFSEEIDPATLSTQSILLIDENEIQIFGWISYNDTTQVATYHPNNLLEFGHTYNIIINNGVLDIVGNNLDKFYIISFNTEIIDKYFPNVPMNLTVMYDIDEVYLNWEIPNNTDEKSIIGYKVYRKVGLGSKYGFIAELNNTFYLDNTIVLNTTYWYYITAYNSFGESNSSNEVICYIEGDKDDGFLFSKQVINIFIIILVLLIIVSIIAGAILIFNKMKKDMKFKESLQMNYQIKEPNDNNDMSDAVEELKRSYDDL